MRTLVSCKAKSRCALSRTVATSKVYLVAASTPGSTGMPGILGRSMTGSTDTALTQVWAALTDICWPCWTVETSCSRNFWAMLVTVSLVASLVVLVFAVTTVNSLRGWEGARRRRHSYNISTDCLVCQASRDNVLHVRQLHVQAAVDAPDLAGHAGHCLLTLDIPSSR